MENKYKNIIKELEIRLAFYKERIIYSTKMVKETTDDPNDINMNKVIGISLGVIGLIVSIILWVINN